ncbi:MAG TPA: hypothetical protein VF482_03800 [Trebonia sp.]
MTTGTGALVRRAYHMAEDDVPAAGFWYVRDGKIQEFNCHIGLTAMFAQLGVLPDFTSAVTASAPAR